MKNKKIVYIGMLSALAFILYSLEISVGFLFPATPFLKIDFSDVPACVGALGFGPVFGVLVELIKNILHIFITKEPAFSGELGNFLSGIAMLLPLSLILREKYSVNRKISAILVSAVCPAIVMIFINLYITLPLYGINDVSTKTTMMFAGFIPFNLIKGIVISLISVIVFDILKKNKIFK